MEQPEFSRLPMVRRDLSGDDYHAAPGWSSSQIKDLAISPFWFYGRHLDPMRPGSDTPQFKFGRLVHTAVLEPHLVDDEYVVAPKIDKRTKAGKEQYAEFVEASAGKTVVTSDEYDLAMNLFDAVHLNDAARSLLEAPGIEFETSGWWRDEKTDLVLKYRADARTPNFVLDLKTTSGPVDADTVSRSVARYRYHSSAAHYLEGDSQCFGTDHGIFVLLFVSKDFPHEVGVYYLDWKTIELGRRQNRVYLRKLADALKRNVFASVNDGEITELSLPRWEINKLGD